MEQIECSEEELSQQALVLRRQGVSIRQIAEVLGISASKAYRLTKAEEGETADETLSAADDTPTLLDLDTLETLAAKALTSHDTKEIMAVLAHVDAHYKNLAARLAQAQQVEADARQALEQAAGTLLQARDAVSRIQAEETKAKAKADLVEASVAVPLWQKRVDPLRTLITQLRRKLEQIEIDRKAAERQAVLVSASKTLEAAQQTFLKAVAEVRQQLAPLDEAIISTDVPLTNVLEAVGRLQIGGMRRDLNKPVRLRFLRVEPSRNFLPGEEVSMSWRTAQDLVWNGTAEILS